MASHLDPRLFIDARPCNNVFYNSFYGSSDLWVRICFAVLAGFIGVQIGFIVLHDASHCAISKYSYINDFLSRITNAFILWDHRLWMTHHVYLHHLILNVANHELSNNFLNKINNLYLMSYSR